MTRYFKRYLKPVRRHPYMLVSSGAIRATAVRIARREAFLLDALRSLARDANPDPREAAHVGGDAQARATLNAAYLAALHAAGGDGKRSAEHARRAKKGLMAYAAMGVPGHSPGYGWLSQLYLVTLAPAYDLVWDLAGWTDGERGQLRRMFYADMGSLTEAMHSKHMSNHGAWPMCRVATTSALFGDEKLITETLDGRDSYAERLAHEFFDDGMNYEQSTTAYQDFSVEPNIITALAARGAGALPDPLTLGVPNNRSLAFRGGSTGDYDMPFYPCDEREFPRPETKDLRLAVTAQFGMLRPDTTCPALGDYGGPVKPSSDSWLTELAWDLYGDRRAARLLSMGTRKAYDSHIFAPHFLTLAFGKPLPAKSRFPAKSIVYPQGGYAVMRSVEGDAFWGSKATTAVLKFGPYGNGHGNADKLHLDLAGGGRKTCIEELDRPANSWKYWNSTVSHNTVVVGGKSQGGNEEMFALNDSCGRLVYRSFSPAIKVACAEAPDVYPGLKTYRRTVAVTDSYVLDVFEVEARGATEFDWFLHGMGTLGISGAVVRKGSLRRKNEGYEFFRNVKSAKATGLVKARFSGGHTVFLPEAAGMTVFTATGPWRAGAGRPVLVVRAGGRRAVFVAVHDPSGTSIRGVSATCVECMRADCPVIVHVTGRGWADEMRIFGSGRAAKHVIYLRKKRRTTTMR